MSTKDGNTIEVSAPTTWAQHMKELKTYSRAALAALGCSSIAVLVGYDMMIIGSIIANKEFIKAFGVHDSGANAWTLPADRQLVWTICQFCAAILGAVTVGQVSDMFGRRVCFITTILLTTIGTVVELVSNHWGLWAFAKIIFGIAMGFMQGNTQVYVSEITPPQIRGFMLSLFQLWIVFGSFLSACVLEGTSKVDGPWSWKAAVISQLGLAAMCLALFLLLTPESPYWLTSKGRLDKAKAALSRIRSGEHGYDIDSEVRSIQATLEAEKEVSSEAVSYLECFKGTDRRRTLLACLPMVMQQFGGFPLCGNYLAYFLTLSGLENAFLITVISLLLAILAVAVSFALIEHVGRRKQLLFGVFSMIPCLLAITVLGWVGRGTVARGQALAAFSIIWSVFYYLSLGAVGWTIVGEISSSRLRAKTNSIATAVNAICNMGWAIAIPYLINTEEANLGPKAGVVFLGPAIILGAIAFFVVPETKGKNFAELDELFQLRTPARKF
ncbi:general substrate transporter [Aaosphaeria arxii CBS 175.79]|uniref:General substrate transporter n=1 Tax=Aaosphaeria arxii CBS 175.79 TaxID=1450172 RepID=A0A6A5XVZ9_9PLEO|nr:general substrate transporter [Aaosphaeria arxii CBS 175.79]KAF2017007.1 general substrate transporter [Aaosphaeria arxii CBS 175.79]